MLKPKENWGTSRRLSWVLQQESVSWNDVLDNIGQPKQTPATSSTVSSSGETSPMSSPTGCRPPRSKVSPVGSQEPFLLRNAQDQFRRAIDAHKLDGSPETRSQALPPTVNRSATYPPAQRTHQESFWGYQQTFDDDETCRSSSSLPAMSRDDSSTLLDVMVDVGGRASTENQTSREFFNTIGKLDAPHASEVLRRRRRITATKSAPPLTKAATAGRAETCPPGHQMSQHCLPRWPGEA